MNFALYQKILAVKPIRRLFLVGMIARIPHSAAGLLLTLHIVLTQHRGFAAAGAAAAVLTIGIAVGAPWRGRRVDTVGLRRALVPSVISEAIIWTVVPHVPYEWVLVLVFVGGLLSLPVFSVVRQSLGVLASGEQRRTAFALDSIATEMVFMIGPAAGAVVATQFSTALGLTIVGLATSLAGLFLIWFNPPTRTSERDLSQSEVEISEAEDSEAACEVLVATAPAHVQEAAGELIHLPASKAGAQKRARLTGGRLMQSFSWFTAAVAAVFLAAAGAGMVLSGTDVGIVALLQVHNTASDIGLVMFFWCAASVVGGLVYGAMDRPVSPLLLLFGMAALTIPMGFAQDSWSLALLSILPGFLCAPVLSAASEKVAELVTESRRGEAMGWYGSALTAGVAFGSPITGVFIDLQGPWVGFVAVGFVGAVLALCGIALQTLRRRRRRLSH
ncbi:MFS transporter [Pseudarthrobacter sp. J1763]|uniref:MFS transporter n=1 Tax=Pseudarthrobacter sp. J1763 TaxID=3420445 RepID=UPI003D2CAB61